MTPTATSRVAAKALVVSRAQSLPLRILAMGVLVSRIQRCRSIAHPGCRVGDETGRPTSGPHGSARTVRDAIASTPPLRIIQPPRIRQAHRRLGVPDGRSGDAGRGVAERMGCGTAVTPAGPGTGDCTIIAVCQASVHSGWRPAWLTPAPGARVRRRSASRRSARGTRIGPSGHAQWVVHGRRYSSWRCHKRLPRRFTVCCRALLAHMRVECRPQCKRGVGEQSLRSCPARQGLVPP